MGFLFFGKGVFIIDVSYQIFEVRDLGACFFWVGGNEVQRFYVVVMVDGKVVVRVKVFFSLFVEYFRLFVFGDFVDGVNKYCKGSKIYSYMVGKDIYW